MQSITWPVEFVVEKVTIPGCCMFVREESAFPSVALTLGRLLGSRIYCHTDFLVVADGIYPHMQKLLAEKESKGVYAMEV